MSVKSCRKFLEVYTSDQPVCWHCLSCQCPCHLVLYRIRYFDIWPNTEYLVAIFGRMWLRMATATLAGFVGPGMDAGSLNARTDSCQSIFIWSLQAHLCLLQQGVFTISAGVLSRRRTSIALFSRSPAMASHFNWAIIIIRIRVFYGSIIRRNTSSLLAHYSDWFEFESNVRYSPSVITVNIKVISSCLLEITVCPDYHCIQQSWSEIGAVAVQHCVTYRKNSNTMRTLIQYAAPTLTGKLWENISLVI